MAQPVSLSTETSIKLVLAALGEAVQAITPQATYLAPRGLHSYKGLHHAVAVKP